MTLSKTVRSERGDSLETAVRSDVLLRKGHIMPDDVAVALDFEWRDTGMQCTAVSATPTSGSPHCAAAVVCEKTTSVRASDATARARIWRWRPSGYAEAPGVRVYQGTRMQPARIPVAGRRSARRGGAVGRRRAYGDRDGGAQSYDAGPAILWRTARSYRSRRSGGHVRCKNERNYSARTSALSGGTSALSGGTSALSARTSALSGGTRAGPGSQIRARPVNRATRCRCSCRRCPHVVDRVVGALRGDLLHELGGGIQSTVADALGLLAPQGLADLVFVLLEEVLALVHQVIDAHAIPFDSCA